MFLENQLLVTKFYVPVTLDALISRPRLIGLLNESLKYPFTLVSAAAGFGKTTLLASWSRSLPANGPRVAWVSLDEEDNEPRWFWSYVLTALEKQMAQYFTPLLMQLQLPQALPPKHFLGSLINLLSETTEQFVLILDDYQVITEPQIHTDLVYLIKHLPAQLRIIVATRADPPLPLLRLQTRERVMEVHTDQLRCTSEETRAFFEKTMGIRLPDETIQEVMVRTEGWLVGLQLLSLSLSKEVNPASLLDEISGNQCYILDYLTDEVIRRQPQDVQQFLLYTSILEYLTAPLCDAVMEQSGSQQMLQRLEQTNLFVTPLDNKRRWYRYHALFAEVLRYRLEQTHSNLVLALHHRASRWYAQQNQITKAIVHASCAHQWQWVAELVERIWLRSFTWGANQRELILLRQWQEHLPRDIVHSQPRLCLACTCMLYQVVPYSMVEAWLNAAETALTASLSTLTHESTSPPMLVSQAKREQENLLGAVFGYRAFLQSFQEEDGEIILSLCQRVSTSLSADSPVPSALIIAARLRAYYTSSVNDAMAAIEYGLQAVSLAQAAEQTALAMSFLCTTAGYMVGAGRLHEVQQLTQRAMLSGRKPAGDVLPEVGYPTLLQAEVLREWNQMDTALALTKEALVLCKQVKTLTSLVYLLIGYATLLHVHLSRGELDAACSVLQQIEHIGMNMNPYLYHPLCAHSIIVDRARLWITCGELDRSLRWAEQLDRGERYGNSFVREREEVAHVRVLLANKQPDLALQRLEPVLQRATAGKRWGHVIEIQILRALAYQVYQEERQALSALSEAIRLGEPQGYIRSFIDEGTPMETLLYSLCKQDSRSGSTSYLDTLLIAFQQEHMACTQGGESSKARQLPKQLSDREMQVLHLIAQGASNQEIAQELIITIDTVKRHISHIFSKLGAHNRVQAVRQAQELSLL